MISSVEITRLRGIRQGKLEDLTPLVVLVGPNACGKSTVLDALLIGASPIIQEGIGQAVVRHQGVKHGARWLLWRTGQDGGPEVVVATQAGARRKCRLAFHETGPRRIDCDAELEGANGASSQHDVVTFSPPANYSRGGKAWPLQDVLDVRIVGTPGEHVQRPLHQVLTECIQRGQRADVRVAVDQLVPGVKDLVILTEEDAPIVQLEYADHSVPAALSGDGIHSFLRISLEFLSFQNGLLLLEEPEAHQHPAAIRQTIRAILAAVRRDVQVVLTTHSLELIDALLAESSDDDLEKLSLYRLELDNGLLISHRLPGSEVAFSRTEIEKDLR